MPQQTPVTPPAKPFSHLGSFLIRHLVALLALSAFTAQAATPRAAEDMDSPVMSSDAPFQRFANPKNTKPTPVANTGTKAGKNRGGRGVKAHSGGKKKR